MRCEVVIMTNSWMLPEWECGDWELRKYSTDESEWEGEDWKPHESSIDESVAAPSVFAWPCSMTSEALAWVELVEAVSDSFRLEPFMIDVLKHGILVEALAVPVDTESHKWSWLYCRCWLRWLRNWSRLRRLWWRLWYWGWLRSWLSCRGWLRC